MGRDPKSSEEMNSVAIWIGIGLDVILSDRI
jgi:hypothetical protein